MLLEDHLPLAQWMPFTVLLQRSMVLSVDKAVHFNLSPWVQKEWLRLLPPVIHHLFYKAACTQETEKNRRPGWKRQSPLASNSWDGLNTRALILMPLGSLCRFAPWTSVCSVFSSFSPYTCTSLPHTYDFLEISLFFFIFVLHIEQHKSWLLFMLCALNCCFHH